VIENFKEIIISKKINFVLPLFGEITPVKKCLVPQQPVGLLLRFHYQSL
jgi:hypothetical protein